MLVDGWVEGGWEVELDPVELVGAEVVDGPEVLVGPDVDGEVGEVDGVPPPDVVDGVPPPSPPPEVVDGIGVVGVVVVGAPPPVPI